MILLLKGLQIYYTINNIDSQYKKIFFLTNTGGMGKEKEHKVDTDAQF
jgi:hypothetical protein